jgi:hypothetical protein
MMRRMVFVVSLIAGTALLLVAAVGCNSSFKTDPVQIQLAIYTPDCVDVEDASTAVGAHVQIYPCGTGKKSQEWVMTGFGSQGTEFMNVNSQLCMAVASDPDTAPGQYIVQYPCVKDGSDPKQLWSVTSAPNGEAGMQLVSKVSSQCLDLPYGAVASIDMLQQYTCTNDDPAQGWTLNDVAMGNTP